MLSLHVIVPVVIAIAAIAGIGTYVLQKSGASAASTDGGTSCGVKKRDGQVYASVVGTYAKFSSARDSDSIRNIAYGLCKKGKLSPTTAQAINRSGNYTSDLMRAYSNFQYSLGYKGAAADGAPGKISLTKLGLTPVGF